jgi:hypothetical protein
MEKTQILSALRAFVRQRPGLEFANYGDAQAYRAEVRSITKDLHHAEELIRAVDWRHIDADSILKATGSGRLSIDSTDKGVRVDWCTGQYWPTEYRRGVASVLASVLWNYWCEGAATAEDIRSQARLSLSRAVVRRFFN